MWEKGREVSVAVYPDERMKRQGVERLKGRGRDPNTLRHGDGGTGAGVSVLRIGADRAPGGAGSAGVLRAVPDGGGAGA